MLSKSNNKVGEKVSQFSSCLMQERKVGGQKSAQNQNGRRDPAPLEDEPPPELGLEEVELGLEVEEVEEGLEVEVEFDPAGGQGRPLIVTPHF